MARLFLFTDFYPFGQGETFVAAEIDYLLAQGIGVHIVPTARGALEQVGAQRPVPQGAVVRQDIAESLAQARAQSAPKQVRALSRTAWRKRSAWAKLACELGRAWRLQPNKARHNLLRLTQALAHAAMFAEVFAAAADGPRTRDGLYAFWLGASALGASWAYPALPVAARAHGHDLFAERHLGDYIPVQQMLVSRLAALYCISEDGGRYARQHFAGAQSRIHVMPLGVAATPFRARPSTDGVLRVVSCARVCAVKDLDRFIAALAHVTTPLVWTHLGDGEDRRRMMRDCSKLPKRITTLWPGAVAHDTVIGHLTDTPVDLFVNTSVHEGRPVSIMEALSVGLPVRAANVGATAEMLPDGWLFDKQKDPQSIARSMDAFAALPEPVREAERQMALLLWQTHANAEFFYPTFARHLLAQLNIAIAAPRV